ncbi:6441_t:CDS:2 [Scutellospora calospora]|uniref:6441_t:CDS:1 n=1 Tax=Scutellospora calospora TaxID=85575 RepID=A0ACA9JU71_9GLOM|nr:6441_t:CDS:2 [Scutellospora calospora]
MQTQKGESKDLSKVDSLKLENIRFMTRIAELEQIVKEKNMLETELKQIIKENTKKAKLRDAKLNARIIELEQSAKENKDSKDVSNIKTSISTKLSYTSNSENMISENNKSLPETKVNTQFNLIPNNCTSEILIRNEADIDSIILLL